MLEEMLQSGPGGSRPGSGTRYYLFFRRVVENQRGNTGPTRVSHLHHLERHGRCHAGVEGIASLLEYVDSRHGGQVVSRRDHAVSPHDPRPHGFDIVLVVNMPKAREWEERLNQSLLLGLTTTPAESGQDQEGSEDE